MHDRDPLKPSTESGAYRGFPAGVRFTPVPNPLLGPLLTEINDPTELKVLLRLVWHLGQKTRGPKSVTLSELNSDAVLMKILGGTDDFTAALLNLLERIVENGLLAQGKTTSGTPVYALNTEAGRRVVEQAIDIPGIPYSDDVEPNVPTNQSTLFALYEGNIGTLSPLLVEELHKAQNQYPETWITDAFREAVANNKRSWRYISRILERWQREGRGDQTSGRLGKKITQPRQFRY